MLRLLVLPLFVHWHHVLSVSWGRRAGCTLSFVDSRLASLQQYPHRTPNPSAWHLLDAGQLRPTGDRVVVRPDPRAGRWASGLYIPDTAEDDARAQTGTVLAVGPQRRDLSPDDRVLYRRWGGTEVEMGAEKLLILPPRDVLAQLA